MLKLLKFLSKKEKIIIMICLILIILSICYFIFKSYFIEQYNNSIAVDCNTVSDCFIQQTGCNCSGYTYDCVNIKAKKGICDIAEDKMTCEAINLKPKSCMCVENQCINIYSR